VAQWEEEEVEEEIELDKNLEKVHGETPLHVAIR
jgi:hypothetical protein